MAAPKYIITKAKQLDNALSRVAYLSNEIAEWAAEQGENECDFYYNNRLDMPFEFDLNQLIDNLNKIA